MNSDLDRLQTYPFEKLAALKAEVAAPDTALRHIPLSLGEPRHPPPPFVLQTFRDNLAQFTVYPSTKGSEDLRNAIARWLEQRFQLRNASDMPCPINADSQVLPVNGTREALFAFAQAVVDRDTTNPNSKPLVISPNPFYQIYEGATYLSGADLYLLNCERDNGYLPNFDAVPEEVWRRAQMIYICTPGNPSGAVMPLSQLKQLIALADQYDFVIASDECYSELYFDDAPPPGLLQACAELGRDDFHRCVVFHSLSKRSNLPGMRSGFVAGDTEVLKKFLLYRTYHGCAMALPVQLASVAAWQDETHVETNRALYRQKFREVVDILSPVIDVQIPAASFYLWLKTPISDLTFTQQLFSKHNVTVLPGSFIARPTASGNPGTDHVRIALVATVEECREAAQRLKEFLTAL